MQPQTHDVRIAGNCHRRGRHVELIDAIEQAQRVDGRRAVRIARVRSRELLPCFLDLTEPQQVRAQLGVGGPQVRLHFDRATQQRRRLAIASAHDFKVRQLLVHGAVARVVFQRTLDPRRWIAITRAFERCAHREHFERRQLLLACEVAGPLQRLLRRFRLTGLERELRGEQMSLDQFVVLVQSLFEHGPRFTLEPLGEHARQADLRMHVVREDLQRIAKGLGCIVVLMRLQEQPRPPDARLHRSRVGLHEIAKPLIRGLQIAERPVGFGLRDRIR
jgi:hypothetical protein